MKLDEKKKMIAGKMYDQTSKGLGSSPVTTQRGAGVGSSPVFKQTGTGLGAASPTRQASTGGFSGRYTEGNGKIRTPMIKGSSKPSQKGKMSLNSQGRNEGEKMMLGKNEHNRA